METDVKSYSLKDFTLFSVDKGIFIAVPVEDDGKYSVSLLYFMGAYAFRESKNFDYFIDD